MRSSVGGKKIRGPLLEEKIIVISSVITFLDYECKLFIFLWLSYMREVYAGLSLRDLVSNK